MKKMKWLIPVIIILIILIAIIIGVLVHKKNNEIVIEVDMEDMQNIGSGGSIHYGSGFDEFEYQTEDVEVERMKQREERQKEMEALRNKTVLDAKKEKSAEQAIREEVKSAIEESVSPMTEETTEETSENVTEETSENEVTEGDIPFDLNRYERDKVIFVAASREVAEDAAKEIGGTVISYENETAVIQISEDVDQLLQRLESQGSSLQFMRKYLFN